MSFDNLGDRMKEYYENIPKTKLMRREPVAIRIDGKCFHTFTKCFQKPFDELLMNTMQRTMKYLCENIQGCVFGYTQSDEITLILIDYQTFKTDAWLNYEVQKMCSIAASMATKAFNKFFGYEYEEFSLFANSTDGTPKDRELAMTYYKQLGEAMFDARCFNIPKEEVCNLIYWRQLDATRNSILSVAQANFSHKEIEGHSCNELQNKLLIEKNVNWNNYPIPCKRGTACIKKNNEWFIDKEMPILEGLFRKYVNKHIYVGEGTDSEPEVK